jgi:serine/threonine protein kinase, bacterial
MTLTLLNNRYRVVQTLGGGGFSNTFLAEDIHMPSARKCVIKQLKPVTNDPQTYKVIQERFQREAAVLEDLGDGNNQIPKLYAYFTEAGQFYLIQEFIEGDTLTKKVEKEGRLSENEVKQLLISLLPVLDYVHGRQMVHRDLKPDNIIIRKRDNLPVLIDFGAVKEAMNTVVNDPRNSVPSMVIGTPGYMPSEQAGGRPTFSSDLYSLGLTAVFLLTGKIPQELETDARTGEFMWRRHAPNINSNLAMVIDQAIRFNARDRFGNAKAMLNALQSSNVANTSASPQAADSEMATVAVAPHRNNPPNAPINNPLPPQTVPVARNPVIKRDNGRKPLIIGALVAGSLIVVATAIALGLRRSDPVPSIADNVPTTEPAIQQQSIPTPASVPTSEPTVPETTPTKTRSALLPRGDAKGKRSGAAPSQSTNTTLPPETRPTPRRNNSPSQPVDTTPPSIASESPTPSQPSNSSPRRRVSPPPADSNNTPATTQRLNIPAFAPGTQRRYVREDLGNPTKETNGLWETRAALYKNIQPGVDLGYLFDQTTGRLRQSEVTFDPSVGRETMSVTLDKILSSNTSPDIQQGLKEVYQGKTNRYDFVSGRDGSLKGVIERNNRDRIYIAVWESDLH